MIDQTNLTPMGDSEPDPDIYLIMDYLTGDLETDQMIAVRERLTWDDAFHERMEPILLAMSLPGPLVSDTSDAERVAGLAAASPIPSFTGDEEAHAREVIRAKLTAPAARPQRSGSVRRLPSWAHGAFRRQLAAAMIVAAVGIGSGLYALQHIRQIEDTASGWSLAHRGVSANVARYAVQLPGLSQVVLEPGSRMWSERAPGSTESVVRLDGAATLDVTDGSGAMLVVTVVGEVFLTPGRYEIAVEDSSAMTVTVERGLAQAHGRGGNDLVLRSGQRVRVVRPGTR
jgi:hypothetical protein